MRLPLSLTLIALLGLAAPAQEVPRLQVDAEQHDFGPLVQNRAVTHVFKVRNAGSAPLTIRRVVPACGCTSTLLGQSTLAPGEATDLQVTLNTTGMSGRVRKTVLVESDDPERPNLTLAFEGDMMRDVEPPEREVWFDRLTPKVRRKASVSFESGTGSPIEVTDADLSEAPWLGVATREQDGRLWVDLDLLARRLPRGQASGTDSITLHVRNPRPSRVRLNVHWARK